MERRFFRLSLPDLPDSGRFGGIGWWLLILFALRVLFLLAALDPEEERVMTYLDPAGISWTQGPERPLFDREELYTATAGEMIRHHLNVPLASYRFMPYASGSLLLALVTVPVYALFGPHYLAFKLIPLLTTMLAGMFWLLFVRAWMGDRAALLFGALVLFAPSVLVRTALIAKGDHPEAMMLIGAVLFLGSQAIRAHEGRSRILLWGVTGAVAGLGVFVTYSTVPILAASAAAVLWRSGIRPSRLHLAALVGFLVGLIPWISNLAVLGSAALKVYGRPLGAMVAPGAVFGRTALMFRQGFFAQYDLPRAAQLGAAFLLTVGVIWGWIILARRWREPFAFLVLLATVVHLLAFCFMAPDASSRYLIPGYPLLLIAVVSPLSPGRRSIPAPWLPLAIVLCGFLAQARVVARSDFSCLRAPLRGTDWPLLGEVLGQKLRPESIRLLPPEVRPFLWIGRGKRTFYDTDRARWDEAAATAGEDAPKFWEGIGMSWAESGAIRDIGPFLRTLPLAKREAVKRGLTVYGEVIFSPLLAAGGAQAVAEFLNTFEPQDQPALRLALARTLGMLAVHTDEFAAVEAEAARLLGPDETLYAAGWGAFRGGRGSQFDRISRPRAGSWMASLLAAGIPADASYYNGAGEAYLWNLQRRSPGWILGGANGPTGPARELARMTEGWTGAQKGILYWMCGRGIASAVTEPFGPAGNGFELSAWPWRTAIPAEFHAAFQEGMAFGGMQRGIQRGIQSGGDHG